MRSSHYHLDDSAVYSSTFAKIDSSLLDNLTNWVLQARQLANRHSSQTETFLWMSFISNWRWNFTFFYVPSTPLTHLLCTSVFSNPPPCLHNHVADTWMKAAVLISSCYVSALCVESRCAVGILWLTTEAQNEEKDSTLFANLNCLIHQLKHKRHRRRQQRSVSVCSMLHWFFPSVYKELFQKILPFQIPVFINRASPLSGSHSLRLLSRCKLFPASEVSLPGRRPILSP